MKPTRGKHNPRSRQIAMAALDIALLGGWVARWSYRLGLHGRLGVTHYEVDAPFDPAALGTPAGVVAASMAGAAAGSRPRERRLARPLVIAFASDFHAGSTTHPEMFEELFSEVGRTHPDVLLLGGDFVSSTATDVDMLHKGLSKCSPPCGKFAVLGNHDLWSEAARVRSGLEAAGVAVLVNRNATLPAPFEGVSICGIDDPWTGEPDVALAFRGAGPVRIFLTHSPDALLLPGQERFDVAFAGHTHGGQVSLPDGSPIVGAGGPLSRTYSRGRFELPGQGPLIVSRGVGCSNLPIRINAHPELVICTLRA
jgi:predicted MPP superfamily phosphohydrolase